MSAGQVILVRRGPIAELRIDNPKKFNAMSLAMWRDVAMHAAALSGDADVRVLLLRGEGEKAFISGADIAEFDTTRSAETGSDAYDGAVDAAQNALMACPFPVVASIHGICMGGGLGLAMACDLRYGALEARFRMPAARLGLGYSHAGIQRMVGVLGAATAADLFFTARTFDGAEARRLRLVHDAFQASELNRHVEETLATIAANAPLTVRLAKQAIHLALGEVSTEAIAQIEAGRRACIRSADYAEGRRAFAEKRPAVFLGK
ncbi:MAG: enoyl-CoA hydratase [Variovorax sp.]|nr:MAG: enoyl-CoA hydratase [Variovorax sp.]